MLDRGVARSGPAISLLFTAHQTVDAAQAGKIWVSPAGACRDCALVVAPRAFSDTVVTFHAGARETSCFGVPKSAFRDKRKGSERFHVEMQISWQAQHFGHGGDLRGALIS